MKGVVVILTSLILVLNCNKFNSKKEWVKNFINNTSTVYDSLLINDPNFSASLSNINLSKDDLTEYFQSYKLGFEIISEKEVYFGDSIYLEIQVDAKNEQQRCSFYFKNPEDWVFSHIMFEDYDFGEN